MCNSNGPVPGHLPSYTRSPYCPSDSRHDCQLPSSIAAERLLNDVNCACPNAAAPRQPATVNAPISCHLVTRRVMYLCPPAVGAARTRPVSVVIGRASGVSPRNHYRAAPLSRPENRGRRPVVTSTTSVDTLHSVRISAGYFSFVLQLARVAEQRASNFTMMGWT